MSAPDIRTALTAMLRATDPGEHALPEAERLGAVRPWARKTFWNHVDDARTDGAEFDALAGFLIATIGSEVQPTVIVPARVAAQAALALDDTPTPPALAHGMDLGQWVTAKRFYQHETAVALAYDAALATDPTLRAGEFAEAHPFTPPVVA